MKTLLDEKYVNLYERENLESNDWRVVSANDKVENILKLIEAKRVDSILDVGCGEGAVLSNLSHRNIGKYLCGIEIADSLVKIVNSLKINNLVSCSKFDGYHIDFPNDKFDLVILSHVIEHVEHPRLLIDEAKRVGKYVAFEVPLEDTIRLSKDFRLKPTGHINFYSYKIFRNLIQSCDLAIIGESISSPSFQVYKFKGGIMNIFKYFIRKYLLFLFGRIITRLFTYHYTVLCSKYE